MVLLKLNRKTPKYSGKKRKKRREIQYYEYDAMRFLGIWEDETIDKKAHDE